MSPQAIAYVARETDDTLPNVGDVCRRQEDGQELWLNERFDLYNHSPTGFAWGYGGSGPAQLSLAILADATNDDELARKYYQAFKFDIVAHRKGNWEITEAEVLEWLEAARKKRE